ncbi:Thiamine biosynthesis lipoprotein [Propionibacterium freudenreichii]|nr:Thiamine biosynthesis lipoprotein [Propionibacterium freudenreichii]SBN95160.1 Thiamine biosynthesis lipoprotein [Propionibacterium freudenreichii]SCC96746.1 Thiamine biosynthesis lipoprotein [Propionibacterium freudenreichii]SCQ48143.1 Thiamine biosynthesis lipoprotein [Propionibacterium freudenreichii]SCQ52415.1 Thiamine biosynthesis lipoprotein [Propionibacterium freudenreichii]
MTLVSAAHATSFHRFVDVEQIMGMPISIHTILEGPATAGSATQDAARRCFADLREVDRVFSPFDPRSDIRRIARGELQFADAPPMLAEVKELCDRARDTTGGLFDAEWKGWFDPTGLVKGWAVEKVARRHLEPLLTDPRVAAVGINAGGDMQLFTHPDSSWIWNVGITDPRVAGEIIATLPVSNGAIATSGTAERGPHIIDPRTGRPTTGILSATVAADSLTRADLWATTAMIAGFDDLSWLDSASTATGLLVAADGRIRRWLGATEITVTAHDRDLITRVVGIG